MLRSHTRLCTPLLLALLLCPPDSTRPHSPPPPPLTVLSLTYLTFPEAASGGGLLVEKAGCRRHQTSNHVGCIRLQMWHLPRAAIQAVRERMRALLLLLVLPSSNGLSEHHPRLPPVSGAVSALPRGVRAAAFVSGKEVSGGDESQRGGDGEAGEGGVSCRIS